ncbi:SGNH/GDSL hydrolase family protein [Paenibacillus sp. IITD108]|uniref:SGNH/GDSL hydrolase family protein n=1 Tax=Paenibacillus sp. IITD108 TaxID=3116649 RepID=UPI002F3FA8AD
MKDRTYVALGDSITAYRNNVKVYMEWLFEERETLGFHRMINNGIGGWNTLHLLDKLEERCLQYQPQFISIMLGTNDHAIYKGKEEPAVSLDQFKSNLREIVRQIRVSAHERGNAAPYILLMSPPFIVTETNSAGTQASQIRLLNYVRAVHEMSVELDTGYLDVNAITAEATLHDGQLYRDNYTDQNDGVHLNSVGQKWLVPFIRQICIEQRA